MRLYYSGTSYRVRFLDSIENDIVRFSYKYRIKGFDIEDIAQELRLHLWNKMHKYNPTMSQFRTWACVVMRNKLIDLSSPRKYKVDSLDSEHRRRGNFKKVYPL